MNPRHVDISFARLILSFLLYSTHTNRPVLALSWTTAPIDRVNPCRRTLPYWRRQQRREVSLNALSSLDEHQSTVQPNQNESNFDLPNHHGEETFLSSLYQKIMEKAGKIDESRFIFPEISSGEVPTLYR
jgi:hypothetical protein